jgi:hypothetical protein
MECADRAGPRRRTSHLHAPGRWRPCLHAVQLRTGGPPRLQIGVAGAAKRRRRAIPRPRAVRGSDSLKPSLWRARGAPARR